MRNRRQEAALRRNPRWCVCMHTADTPTIRTKRGSRQRGLGTWSTSAHFTACQHSTLRETTMVRPQVHLRRIPGTRGVTVSLADGPDLR